MHRFIDVLSRSLAVLGGLVLVGLVALTVLSVGGRGLNTFGHSDFVEAIAPSLGAALIDTGVGAITGDFELIEAGVAFAVFCFLPICQLHGAHASVDVFTSMLPARANRALIAFWEVVLSAAIILIAWRLSVGLGDKMRNGEITFLLQFPVWWSYAASFAAASIAALVSVYCALGRLVELVSGRDWFAQHEASDQ